MPPVLKTLMKYIERVCVHHAEEIIKPEYKELKKEGDHPLFGLCYAASEAFYYLAKKQVPHIQMKGAQARIFWRGNWVSHWIVIVEYNNNTHIVDITAGQFLNEIDVPYHSFIGRGFKPNKSHGASLIMNKVDEWLYLLPQ